MIVIGIPCGETIKSHTALSLFNLKHHDAKLVMQRSADVAENRNRLAQTALDMQASHILFVDSDMSFHPDTLDRMLAHNKDILGLAANRKKLPLESVVKSFGEKGELPKELFEAKSCGTGLMLIKTEVFRNLEKPWFDFAYIEGERYSEDVLFCALARENGYQIWVDPTIGVGHCGEYVY